ncbi:hypothetical protein SDC9_194345 [bioreactor metagenome]|uniref:Uncharacterized protein n=1 Tax=bioreactor metagenome TaxID=1076179 RepID=A0A645I605_9ZZZZ
MAGDELFYLAVGDEQGQADARLGAVVADDGKILHTGFRKGLQQLVRPAQTQKASDHYGHAVLDF